MKEPLMQTDEQTIMKPIMPASIHTLFTCLEAQQALYQGIKQQLLAKKVAILQQDLQALKQADGAINTLRRQLLPLERQRLGWINTHYVVETSSITEPAHPGVPKLEALIGCLPLEQQHRLRPVAQGIKNTLLSIERLQSELATLLGQSLQWVEDSLSVVKVHQHQASGDSYQATASSLAAHAQKAKARFVTPPALPSKPTVLVKG
jgi:hypothetical protein